MTIKLEPLPYPRYALKPHLSEETLALHHGKHHAGYVRKLRELIGGTPQEDADLESLVRHADGRVFETAAQVWNHDFYWRSLTPDGGGRPDADLQTALRRSFGSLGSFRSEFVERGEEHFGSGWLWLIATGEALRLETTHDADTPLRHGETPLLCADLWEHAYYVDYQNERGRYLREFLRSLAHWRFASQNFAAALSGPP